jgi:hypothetical protein
VSLSSECRDQRPLTEGSNRGLCGMIRGSNTSCRCCEDERICGTGLDNRGHSRWVNAVAAERCPSWPIVAFFVTTVQIWLIPYPVPFPLLISVPSVSRAAYSYGLNMEPAYSRNLVSTIIQQHTCCHVPDDKIFNKKYLILTASWSPNIQPLIGNPQLLQLIGYSAATVVAYHH